MKNLIGVTLISAAAATATATASSSTVHASQPTGATYASGFDMTKSWANLSPYKDADGFNIPKGVPQGCELSQVHVLHRHAQRFPTAYPLDGDGMGDFAAKLANYSKAHPDSTSATGPLKFLNNWEYILGEDLLLENGAATEATSGANFWINYGRLLYRAGRKNLAAWSTSLNVYSNGTARPTPVFRTTSQARILESARWWLSGFFGNSGANTSYDQYDLVIIPEEYGFNNTLASYEACTGDMSEGDNAAEVFVSRYTKDARSRLSSYLPRDFNLTASNVLAMQNICVYEHTSLGGSSFCSLFTEQEWKDFEYNVDVQYYGDYAYGSPTGRAQGIGYVLELAARLQHKLITSSDTSINYTYDDNLAQFPFGQPFYMDMSHDDIILSVINALGLSYFRYGPNGLPGDVDHAPKRNFSLSQMTPFGARMISEIWTCPQNTSFSTLDPVLISNPSLQSKQSTTDYIRFVLNSAPLPLNGLVGCESANEGFCPVEQFLRGVPTLKRKAEYQWSCFGNYTTGSQVADGVPDS
ncbi:Histidine phosphatase superfamily clade-2 [Penicillium malachiteum]|uniref:Histidine phosphatase superfamily clade-2 n=1 Tax=Penicillium malachiteum TaxID=1324776 RepID=UPI0025472E6C|nr:Histidine phosphatase superfamily clade-2 [Penicillium malachiteum]KAJ5726309.1 Histidine phosphatase superfamily clade-2 [Penicillium malachiteum]